MAELTTEQIELAAKALWRVTFEQRKWCATTEVWEEVSEAHKEEWREWARAAAPFLQIQWGLPTGEEIEAIYGTPKAMTIINDFVVRRNRKLYEEIFQPVDPRRDKIYQVLYALGPDEPSRYLKATDAILEALDAND